MTGFLNVTTSEKKNDFLLTQGVFRKTKLWPLGPVPWWPFLIMQGQCELSFSAETSPVNQSESNYKNILRGLLL